MWTVRYKLKKQRKTTLIDKQNKNTLELKVDYDKKLAEYYTKLNKQEKLLKGKPSNECEDIKRSLDDVIKLNLQWLC